MHRANGFTLVEMVCVLAIMGLLAAIVLPNLSVATTSAELSAYSLEIAALLKADRNAAVRNRATVSTTLSVNARWLRSGDSRRVVQLPADVHLGALLAQRCGGSQTAASIEFLPTGMSCGGVIQLTHGGSGYQIRVNWLTGGVDVVSFERS